MNKSGIVQLIAAILVLLAGPTIPSAATANLRASHPTPGNAARAAERRAEIPLPADEAPGLRVIESSPDGIVLALTTPQFQVEERALGDGSCQAIAVAGYGETDRSGWPALPVRGALVGIPPGAAPILTVLQADGAIAAERYSLCPVSQPIVGISPAGEMTYEGVEQVADAAAYAADSFYPAVPVELVATGMVRSQPVAQLRFQPLHYNPVTGELRHYRRIVVRLTFGVDALPGGAAIDEGSFERILERTLVNYDQARHWRVRPAAIPAPTFPVQQDQPQFKVLVDQDGIYELSYDELQAAGAPVDEVDPRTFHLSNHGAEVAIYVAGEDDGEFDPADHILFYGQKTTTRYTDVNVYWLTWGANDGLRMAEIDGTPGGTAPTPSSFQTERHMEEDHRYSQGYPSGEGDRWYWSFVNASGTPASVVHTTTLHHVATAPLSVTVQGLLRSYDAIPYHHTQVYLNGHLVDDAEWFPNSEHFFEAMLPQSVLTEGVNTVLLHIPLDGGVTLEMLWDNWFHIIYHDTYVADGARFAFDGDEAGTWEYRVQNFLTSTIELYDTTVPTQPTRIVNALLEPDGSQYTLVFEQTIGGEHHYLAQETGQRLSPLSVIADSPSDLRDVDNQADYLLVTHGDYYSETLPLAAYHAAQGLAVAVVDVQDVYDEFNGGVLAPEAIRDFIAYAYASWAAPAPTYVLLMGDGTYDFKDNKGYGIPTLIPPYLLDVDPWMGETAADNRYVTVSGEDVFPDMHLGRLTVRTGAETAAVVDKIIGYATSSPQQDWQRQVLFVADDADDAGDFAAISDGLIDTLLPPPYQPERVYLGITHPYEIPSIIARAAIVAAINDGRVIVNYVGHGSIGQWAGERLLGLSDVPSLTNIDRLPMMLPMTCLEGYYIYAHPSIISIAEQLVRAPGGGAIASWSPTGLGVVSGHDYLNSGFLEGTLFEGMTQIGPATTYGKYYLYSHTGGHRDLLDTYLLFGDPALDLNLLQTDVAIDKQVDPAGPLRPGDFLTYTLAYSNSGPATAFNVVISDVLPAGLISPTVVFTGADITPRAGAPLAWDVADLLAGEGGTITVTARVDPFWTAGFSNTATITSTAVETRTTNNVSGPLFTPVVVPDLAIHKEGPTDVLAGSLLTYTIAYSNVGTFAARQVVITDSLPTALLSPTVVAAGASITPRPGSQFVWDVEDLPVGAWGVITVSAIVSPAFSGLLSNTAVIATPDVESDVGNNVSGPVVTGVNIPNLHLTQSGPAQVRPGAAITYTLYYRNVGAAEAEDVILVDTLPLSVTSPTTMVWRLGTLGPGAGGSVVLTAALDAAAACAATLTNTAVISTASWEYNLADNRSWGVAATVCPDLALRKSGPEVARAGGAVTYTLVYSNHGAVAARQVVISDVLPSDFITASFAAFGAAVAVRPGSRFVWDLAADLAPGDGGTIVVTATLDSGAGGIVTNTAVIAAADPEPSTHDNAATWLLPVHYTLYLPLVAREY
ncbi:MAG: DUF11 domain-containing protein [Anaerolineae bacterium]|nr:DUF11 domain-containing protein [Anaerolineae bacterium]